MKLNKEFYEKIINSLIVASFFSLTLFLFAPSYLYFTNALEFGFLFSSVFHYLIIRAVISIFLLQLNYQESGYNVFYRFSQILIPEP